MKRFGLKVGAILMMNASLVACGGGGGGGNDGGSAAVGSGSGSGSPTISAPYSAISQTNYPAAAAAGAGPFTSLTDLSGSFDALTTGVEVSTPSISLANVSATIYLRFGRETPQFVTGAVRTVACSGGGTLVIADSTSSNDNLSAGDRGSFTANNCVEGDLGRLNGTVSFTVTSVAGDPATSDRYSLGLAAEYSNFTIASGTDSITVNGDLSLLIRQNGSNNVDVNATGNTLSLVATESGANRAARLTSYSLTGTEINGVSSFSGNYTLSGSTAQLGDFTYRIETSSPVVQSSSSTYPSSGTMVIHGSPASVTVNALNSGMVRLDYSAAGDGTISASRTLSWSEFEALQ